MTSGVALQQLAERASEGHIVPPVRVVTGGGVLLGYLGTAEQEAAALRDGLAEHYFNEIGARKRSRAEAAYGEAYEEADHLLDILGSQPSADTFALLNCVVWPASGGDGAEVRLVRIRFSAVDAWWIGAEKKVGSGSGAGVFAGALFPIPSPS